MTNIKHPTVDREQLRALLRCYWRLSTRGRAARSMGGGDRPRSVIYLIVMYVFVGLMTGAITLVTEIDLFTYAVLVHSMTFFVVGMALTAESGDILFNANETDVLMHRPIHPRTLLLAKSINLIGFSLVLASALNLFPTFFGLMATDARPWYPLAHVVSMILLCIFCAAAVVCTYGLVIRFLDREKFDNFAAWSQVGLTILFVVGYQIVPRMLDRLEALSFAPYAQYMYPLPPAWFAAIDSVAAADVPVSAAIPLGITGWLATIALAYVAFGKLAPSYGEGLARLNETRARIASPSMARTRAKTVRNPILGLWLRDPIERWSFRLAAAYMRRDREIKLRLYPSLALFLVLPLINLLDGDRGEFSAFGPLLAVFMLGLLPQQALQTLQMSQHYLAADIFAIAPLSSAAPVFHGVRKATICYLLLPALCLAAIMIGYLSSDGLAALTLALPGLIAIPVFSLAPALMHEYLPLSRPATRGEQSARTVTLMLVTMFATAGVLVLSLIAWKMEIIWYVVGVEVPMAILVYAGLNRIIRNRPLVRTYDDLFSYGRGRE